MKINKKSVSYFAVFVLSVFGTGSLCMNNLYAESAGPQAYMTGAPGDNGACDVCHNSFALNSGSAKFSISGSKRGTTARITVSFTNAIGASYGFEMTALDANGIRVGTFKSISSTTQVIIPNDNRGLLGVDAGKYIEQTTAGTTKKSWSFNWEIPANATKPITFYAAGIVADGNGAFTNDYVYTTKVSTRAKLQRGFYRTAAK